MILNVVNELQPFLDSMAKVPKSGMHNPLRNVERYLNYGDISRKVNIIRSFLFKKKKVSYFSNLTLLFTLRYFLYSYRHPKLCLTQKYLISLHT